MKWKQRELEFRGLSCSEKEWSYGVPLCVGQDWYIMDNDLHYFPQFNNNDFIHVFPNSILQYTGVKDINGKKIFEGDIIQYEYGVGYVLFKDMGFCLGEYDENKQKLHIFYMIHADNLKIIGNVFQNPELVEKYKLEVGE